jgi:hypothetical protein
MARSTGFDDGLVSLAVAGGHMLFRNAEKGPEKYVLFIDLQFMNKQYNDSNK